MTKTEIETMKNVIARLKAKNLGCSNVPYFNAFVEEANADGLEVASRLYLDTWIIPSLEMLLPGEGRDPKLAVKLSRR